MSVEMYFSLSHNLLLSPVFTSYHDRPVLKQKVAAYLQWSTMMVWMDLAVCGWVIWMYQDSL